MNKNWHYFSECKTFSDEFVMYGGKSIGGYNIKTLTYTNREKCMEKCLGYPVCKTTDYAIGKDKCYPSKAAWLEVPEGNRNTGTSYDLYQRQCNW